MDGFAEFGDGHLASPVDAVGLRQGEELGAGHGGDVGQDGLPLLSPQFGGGVADDDADGLRRVCAAALSVAVRLSARKLVESGPEHRKAEV